VTLAAGLMMSLFDPLRVRETDDKLASIR